MEEDARKALRAMGETAVPSLIKTLAKKDSRLKEAVNELALQDQDEIVRQVAASVLLKIDPEAAAKAGATEPSWPLSVK